MFYKWAVYSSCAYFSDLQTPHLVAGEWGQLVVQLGRGENWALKSTCSSLGSKKGTSWLCRPW